VNGVAGIAFWLAFAGLFVWCAVATRRHDRKAELDVYAAVCGHSHGRRYAHACACRDQMDDDRMTGAPW